MTTLPPEAAAALARLRAAGEDRDWNACRAALAEALDHIPAGEMIAWLLGPLAAYLPRFERYHPGESWPRERLAMLLAQAPDFAAVIYPPWLPETGRAHESPGSTYFVAALEHLWRAIVDKDHPVPHLVDAIAALHMADLVEGWFAARPDAWTQWQSAVSLALDMDDAPMMIGSPDQKAAVRVMLRFFDHPATARRDRAGWLGLADALENRIRRGL